MRAGIAGAGIMGQLLAFSLRQAGWDVTLFDDNAKDKCSMVAAGLLTPVGELEKHDLIIFQLGESAIKEYWPTILSELPKKIYFKQVGTLILCHPRDHNELMLFIRKISHKLDNHNYYKKLNQEDIHQLEPELGRFNHGYYFPTEGQLDNQMLLSVLEEYLIKNGVTWNKNSFVSEIKPYKVKLKNKIHTFDLVLDCRGLGAKKIFQDLRGVRGELVWLQASDITLTRPIRFLHPRYSIYIVPRSDQIYLIGASEIESEDVSPISVRTTLELLTAAYSVHSNFGEARIIKTMTHCRPTLANHLPKIKYSAGFVAVNGLYRHGFLVGPTLMSDIMRWIEHGISSVHYPQLWEEYVDDLYSIE